MNPVKLLLKAVRRLLRRRGPADGRSLAPGLTYVAGLDAQAGWVEGYRILRPSGAPWVILLTRDLAGSKARRWGSPGKN